MHSDEIKEELREKGIKNTRVKSLLLHLLKNADAPMDVSSLHAACQKETLVNLVTVYRTLQQFHEKALVQEFMGKDGASQYEYIPKGSIAHPHFQCEKCNRVICLDKLGFDDALYFSTMAKQHRVNSINITLNGVCEACL